MTETDDWLPQEAWQAFEEMRRAKGSRAPWTAGAKKRAKDLLREMFDRGEPIADVLWTCVEHGWSGVEWGLREVKRHEPAFSARPVGSAPNSKTGAALVVLQGMKR